MNEKLLVIDLSHYDPAKDYEKVKASGIAGVIYKATQGTGYTDNTYQDQRHRAVDAGLLWGAYHFGESGSVEAQANHFLEIAEIGEEDLFCLDFEDYPSTQMSVVMAKQWIGMVEKDLGREGQCVFYSGNTIKDMLGSKRDKALGARRLWIAQYGSKAVCQASWDEWWLWQYTDTGEVPGCEGGIDCNYFDGTADQLADEWATGVRVLPPEPLPPSPPLARATVTITIAAPPDVEVIVNTVPFDTVSKSKLR